MESVAVRRKGWFRIDGVQDGDRTLEEQLTGLSFALAEAEGKRVLDLGSAEGLISNAFARAGATVLGIECNLESLAAARCADRVEIMHGKIGRQSIPAGPWDITLALAILHKLRFPEKVIADICAKTLDLIVVRLPGGSTGIVKSKHFGTLHDLNAAFVTNGCVLEKVVPGPRDELVQYWRR